MPDINDIWDDEEDTAMVQQMTLVKKLKTPRKYKVTDCVVCGEPTNVDAAGVISTHCNNCEEEISTFHHDHQLDPHNV